jgi:hypothetical protein
MEGQQSLLSQGRLGGATAAIAAAVGRNACQQRSRRSRAVDRDLASSLVDVVRRDACGAACNFATRSQVAVLPQSSCWKCLTQVI